MYRIKYWDNETNEPMCIVYGFKTFNQAKKEAEECIKNSEENIGYEIINEAK